MTFGWALEVYQKIPGLLDGSQDFYMASSPGALTLHALGCVEEPHEHMVITSWSCHLHGTHHAYPGPSFKTYSRASLPWVSTTTVQTRLCCHSELGVTIPGSYKLLEGSVFLEPSPAQVLEWSMAWNHGPSGFA